MARLLILFLFPLLSFSGVNLKNGNFYISYTDIISNSRGKSIELTRTYNSKSTHLGWFGYGWGTPFETRIEAQSDGSVIVYENGSGGKSRFVPSRGLSQNSITKTAKRIVAQLKANSSLTSKAEKQMFARLLKDSEYRNKMANKAGVKVSHPVGQKLRSFDYGKQSLEVVGKGFKRIFDSGLTQYFNIQGDLIASVDKTNYRIKFERDKSTRRVKRIFDNYGNQINISWTSNGFVKKLTSTGSGSADFTYSGQDLASSRDINGNKYTYGYDTFHNLVSIKDHQVRDKKIDTMRVTYQPKTFFATSLKKRSGDVTKYVYGSNPRKKDLHYWTIVEKSGINNQRYANHYEYEHKRRADGSKWLYRTKFTTAGDLRGNKVVGGITRETFNNECCELPVKIVQGSRVTNFRYENGLMVSKKSSDGDFAQLQYDSKTKKVSKVTNNDGWIKYGYNKKGDLKVAKDSKGRAVSLIYDLKGKISKMVDIDSQRKKRVISFVYNTQGKPTQISMDGVGKIVVGYDSFGQVKKVDSSGGRQIASQVTSAFRNLLNIVKPAGVNLNL